MSSAEQWIVPCSRMPKNSRTTGSSSSSGGAIQSLSLPLVSFQWSQILRASSVSRLTSGKPWRARELQGALADEQAVVGALHHDPGDGRGVHDVAERGDRAAAVGRAVHHGGVELDDAFLVGDAAVADGVVVGVGLDDRDAFDRGVERVGAGLDQLHGLLDRAQAVGAGDDDGAVRPDGRAGAAPIEAAPSVAALTDRNVRRFKLSGMSRSLGWHGRWGGDSIPLARAMIMVSRPATPRGPLTRTRLRFAVPFPSWPWPFGRFATKMRRRFGTLTSSQSPARVSPAIRKHRTVPTRNVGRGRTVMDGTLPKRRGPGWPALAATILALTVAGLAGCHGLDRDHRGELLAPGAGRPRPERPVPGLLQARVAELLRQRGAEDRGRQGPGGPFGEGERTHRVPRGDLPDAGRAAPARRGKRSSGRSRTPKASCASRRAGRSAGWGPRRTRPRSPGS